LSDGAARVTLSWCRNAVDRDGIARLIRQPPPRAPGIRSMEPGTDTGRRRPRVRPLFRFAAGLGYLALVAHISSSVTEVDFLPMFLAIVAGAAACTTLAITWLTCSALREDARAGQFGLGSLFFLTTFAAIYFGLIRWLVVHSRHAVVRGPIDVWQQYLAIGLVCVFLSVLAVPFLVIMADSLVWLAVWIVRRPKVRRWLQRWRSWRDRQ
jgi:hypothetical protein